MTRNELEIIEDHYEEQLREDRRRINQFTHERMVRQDKDKLQKRLDDLFKEYLDSEECRFMRFSQLEDLRKFYVYILKNL